MPRIKAHLSYANVVSTLALFLVLVGTGVAATISVLDKGEKKQVRKIARKVANQRINTLGPNLSVANATNAQNATNATNAVNAQNATNAANAALATELQFFGQPIWNGGTSQPVGGINAGTCIDFPVAADTAQPGDNVVGTVNGGSAPNPLPAGITATFLLDTGNVILRLCNPTGSNVSSFNVDWTFVVLRDTSPD
jgi:hypothetical protein